MENRERFGELGIASHQFAKYEKYWLAKLAGELIKTSFPYDFPKAGTGPLQMESVKYEFSQEISTRLIQLSNHSDSRLHMILTAALYVQLEQYTGLRDIIVGTPIYRQKAEGEFINTVLALRNRLNEDITFKELILQVRQTIVEAAENQNYPIEMVLEQLNMPMGENNFPLFGVAILVENIHPYKYIDPLPLEMVFSFLRGETDIELKVKYNGSLYGKGTIERIIAVFAQLLETLLFDVEVRVVEAEILSGDERKRILYEFNDTAGQYPRHKTITALFADQVRKKPHRVAVVYDHKHMTYGALHDRSARLAGAAGTGGIRGNVIAALLVERSLEMIVGIFGILKAGGAYLPLDPHSPLARNRRILKDSSAGIIITQTHLVERNSEAWPDWAGERMIMVDDGKIDADESPGAAVPVDLNDKPGNPAYILYTSGTTGTPKGVVIEHRSVNNLVSGLNERIYERYGTGLRVSLVAPYIFDASVQQVFAALLLGHTLYLVPEETRVNGEGLLDFYRKEGIHISDGTPAHLRLMLEALAEKRYGLKLKHLLIGGEALPAELVRDFLQGFAVDAPLITNLYGPAESCVDTTSFEVAKENINALTHIPIGTAMLNKEVYILDKKNRPRPIGLVGELCIGGVGAALGYLNRPELTGERFFFYRSYRSSRSYISKRIYKTGDLARWLVDGNIEFLGRCDSQVKIRGFRIELGEIENQLLKHEKIKDAVVIVVQSGAGSDNYLFAYVVPEGKLEIPRLKDFLSGQLPGYMIPSYFKQVEKIPLTPNGKRDLRALPDPGREVAGGNYVAPAGEIEEKLAALWHEVLDVPLSSIGVYDNFFDLGGHSLKAVTLVNRIRKVFHVEFPLREVFSDPTIRLIAGYIARADKQRYEALQPVEKREYYPCSSVQKSVYILHQMEHHVTAYNIPAVLVLEGNLHRERLEQAFRQSIKRHEALRTSFELLAGEPVQRIHDGVEFEIEYDDLQVTGAGDRCRREELPFGQVSDAFGEINQAETGGHHSSFMMTPNPSFFRPFDLSRAPLLRVGLTRENETKHLLMIDMHHIISDGTSTGILAVDFFRLYAGNGLYPLRISYRDYSEWRNRQGGSSTMRRQEAFWLEELKGELPVLNLPTDYERKVVQGFAGNTVDFEIGREETAGLQELAAAEGATLYMALLSLCYIVLSKAAGQEDIVVGTVVEGRNHDDLRQVMGMFVNTLPLRNYPRGEKTFRGFLREVKESTLNAFENRDYPFKELVEKIPAPRDIRRNPLFDAAFIFLDLDIAEVSIPGLKLRHYEYKHPASKFDITIIGREKEKQLFFTLRYRTGLFKEETVAAYARHFEEVLSSIRQDPDIKLQEITLAHDLVPAKSSTVQTAFVF